MSCELVMDSNCFFAVNIPLPKIAALARSKQLMPFTVKFRLDFLVCGLQGDLLWYLSRSAPCFHVKPRSNEELSKFSF